MSSRPGRAFVIRALRVPSLGLMLCGVLAELGWGGWKLVGLPSLLSATRTLLESEPTLTLRLLASLQNTGKLGEVDIVWKRSVDGWIQKRLSSWEISDEWIDDLYNILSLSVFCDSLPPLLVPMIECLLDTTDPEADWQTSHANAAWVIGTCMRALSRSVLGHASRFVRLDEEDCRSLVMVGGSLERLGGTSRSMVFP